MFSMFDPENFFSLDSFEHKALWKKDQPVWSALKELREYLNQTTHRIEIEIPDEISLRHPEAISIGENTVIEPGVMIQGPCIIGKNCVIRHGAYIREGVILGDHCHIGHASEVKNSILLNHAAATHFVYLGDSILGNGVNLGAGVKCANLRLDRKEILIHFERKLYDTGLKKMGAILGDGVQIGCNSVLNPGTLVGKYSISHPMMNLGGVVPEGHQVSKKGVFPMNQKILSELLCKSNTTAIK